MLVTHPARTAEFQDPNYPTNKVFLIMNNQNTPKAFLILTESKINDESIQTVNARLLWKWIESKSRFNDWIKRRIQEGKIGRASCRERV